MTENNREFIKLAITRTAKDKLDHIAAERDMKLMGVSSRLIEWFVSQDEFLQTVVLGLIPEQDKIAVVELILNRLKEMLSLRIAGHYVKK